MSENVKVFGVFNRDGLVSLHKTRASANAFATDERHANEMTTIERMFVVEEVVLKP